MRTIDTANHNAKLGDGTLHDNTGTGNVAIGTNAGRYITGGAAGNVTGANSVIIGNNAKSLSDGQTNEIVIGHEAVGLGSNTAVIGNDSVTKTVLKGSVGTGVTAPSAAIHAVKTTEQLRLGYDATNYLSVTISSSGSATINLAGTGPTFTFSKSASFSEGITIADAKNIVLNTTTGTKIGTATGQKIGFFNATPVVQQTGIAAQKVNYTAGDLDTEAEIITAINTTNTALNALRTALNALGLTSVV